MFFEDYGDESPQDKLASEIYRIREKSMASSRKSHSNSSDYEVKTRTNDKWIEFYPPQHQNKPKLLRLFSPTGLFEEKVDISMIKKHFFMPEMLIIYTDGSIESFNDIHYKIEVEDTEDE
ncbi:g073 [Yersinia phage phiR1-37]|uniref:hypothetical protein n=1 Tax=Yersinia phage phiR1-37 TaxID=331278 RepID=UPI00022DBCF5|nr:hypothetical protein phiR1-37_gp073 [Yersinia phage phiR1-37]CCE26097.1 g073 [Yersinia phage phiR1-37]